MSRRTPLITQADYARAIRAAQQCGAGAVEVKPAEGIIRIMPSPEFAVQAAEDHLEPDDKVVL